MCAHVDWKNPELEERVNQRSNNQARNWNCRERDDRSCVFGGGRANRKNADETGSFGGRFACNGSRYFAVVAQQLHVEWSSPSVTRHLWLLQRAAPCKRSTFLRFQRSNLHRCISSLVRLCLFLLAGNSLVGTRSIRCRAEKQSRDSLAFALSNSLEFFPQRLISLLTSTMTVPPATWALFAAIELAAIEIYQWKRRSRLLSKSQPYSKKKSEIKATKRGKVPWVFGDRMDSGATE